MVVFLESMLWEIRSSIETPNDYAIKKKNYENPTLGRTKTRSLVDIRFFQRSPTGFRRTATQTQKKISNNIYFTHRY